VFYAVARYRSFSRAAEALHTSQPNVSRHIRQLERELGTELFRRLGRSIALTDAGRIVYDRAERIFAQVTEMRRALAELEGLERGYLRLGASSTPGLYLLPQVVAAFQRCHPGLKISLHLGNSRGVVEQVLADRVDLGFVGGYVESAGLQVQPFATDEVALVAPADHPLGGCRDVEPAQLHGETFIVRETGSATRQVTEEALDRLGIVPRRTLEMNSCEAVKRAVAAGLGVSFISRYAISLELAQGMLVAIEGPALRFPRLLHVISHKDTRPSAAALAFSAYLHKTAI